MPVPQRPLPEALAMTNPNLRDFSERFVRDQHKVYGYILTLVPNRTEAEDIFQQTSLTLWEKWERFDPSGSFFGWACGIARNHVRNFLRVRSNQRHQYLPDDLLEAVSQARLDDEGRHDARRAALAACMDALAADQRRLIERRYATHKSLSDLAGELGLTANALYKSVGRVRQVLFDCITRRTEGEAGR